MKCFRYFQKLTLYESEIQRRKETPVCFFTIYYDDVLQVVSFLTFTRVYRRAISLSILHTSVFAHAHVSHSHGSGTLVFKT